MRHSFVIVAMLSAWSSCTPYNPDLGEEPFRCGSIAPLCPLGYTCEKVGERSLCLSEARVDMPDDTDTDPTEPTGPTFTCADDSQLEPNETLLEPYVTPIPASASRFSLQGLSICPVGDTDVFRFGVDKDNQMIRVDVRYLSERGLLDLDILDENGASIREGTPFEDSSDHLRAELPEVPIGTYFVQVKAGAPDAINNYGIDIAVIGL